MLIKGTLIKCNREAKTFKGVTGEPRLYISLANVVLTDVQMKEIEECFKDSGNKFTPSWVKEKNGYVNVSTKYELPCDLFGKCKFDSIEDAISDGELNYFKSEVTLSVNLKDGAIYPKAIRIDVDGEPLDPFEDFD